MLSDFPVIMNSDCMVVPLIRVCLSEPHVLRKTRRTHIEDLHQEGSLIPLKAEAVRSSHRFMEKKIDDSLIQKLLIEHKIMLDYDRYRKARPSKTPIDLIPDHLEIAL